MSRRYRRWPKADHRPDTRRERFVGLPFAVVKSEAYRHLSPLARSILVEILTKFNGYNNGELGIGYRELARRLNRKNQSPFSSAIIELIEHGLVAVTTEGCWQPRRAREYRITWINTSDGLGRPIPATNDYLHWVPAEKSRATTAVAA